MKLRIKEFVQKPVPNADIEKLCKILHIRFNDLEYKQSDPEFFNNTTYTLVTTGNTVGDCENKIRHMKTTFTTMSTVTRTFLGDYEKFYSCKYGIVYVNYDNKKTAKAKIVMIPSHISICDTSGNEDSSSIWL